MRIKHKFILTLFIILIFTVTCTLLEIPWWHDLRAAVGPGFATLTIGGLAFLPGIMISLNICGIVLDRPRRRPVIKSELPSITILIAAYNEGKGIYDTLKSLSTQGYPQQMIVKVIDNNSKDNTKEEIFRAKKDFRNIEIEYIFESQQGKYAALNRGLAETTTPYVITLDADTFLYRNAITTICNAMAQESQDKKVGAMAGAVFVRNSRDNLLAQMQEWEYFLSIAGIKRMQGLFQSILVAQGAFSIYNTAAVKEIGGWLDSIGEDIVLTWNLLSRNYKTYYCDEALSFTNVPTNFHIFCRQRSRWARGMIEGFRHFKFKECKNKYAKFLISLDLFLFVIDNCVTFIFIPGIIYAILFHNYLIFGPMTLLLLPITFLIFLILYISEKRRVFDYYGMKSRKHFWGFLLYVLTYSLILSPVSVRGYFQEFFKIKRKWR